MAYYFWLGAEGEVFPISRRRCSIKLVTGRIIRTGEIWPNGDPVEWFVPDAWADLK